MHTLNKDWIIKTLEQLPPKETEQLINYMEFLVWKAKKDRRKGRPKRIIEAINKSHDVTMEDAEALLQSIKEGEILMQKMSSLDESQGKS